MAIGFGLVIHPLIPGRSEPSDKAEMVTQLIFGELYTVLESKTKWILIENIEDGYQCWIDSKMHTAITNEDKEAIAAQSQKRCGDSIGFLVDESGRRFAIPCSAILPGYNDGSFELLNKRYLYEGRIARHDTQSPIRHAKRLLNSPYLWGGKSAFGIDCSGLVQVVFDCAGIKLPRDAYKQAEIGEPVDFIDLAIPGDLVYFDNDEGRIIHVGILLEKDKIIHASGKVRIDTIDHQGIYNHDSGSYSHKTRLIKRLSR